MHTKFAIATAVQARAGDVVSVFFVSRGTNSGPSVWDAFKGRASRAANSPLLFNETARAWSMTDAHAVGPGSRLSGEAKQYTEAPDPLLPVAQMVRGIVVETATISDMAYGHTDTIIRLDVLESRTIAPGENWIPRLDG